MEPGERSQKPETQSPKTAHKMTEQLGGVGGQRIHRTHAAQDRRRIQNRVNLRQTFEYAII